MDEIQALSESCSLCVWVYVWKMYVRVCVCVCVSGPSDMVESFLGKREIKGCMDLEDWYLPLPSLKAVLFSKMADFLLNISFGELMLFIQRELFRSTWKCSMETAMSIFNLEIWLLFGLFLLPGISWCCLKRKGLRFWLDFVWERAGFTFWYLDRVDI